VIAADRRPMASASAVEGGDKCGEQEGPKGLRIH
jgi:hypothetical protein